MNELSLSVLFIYFIAGVFQHIVPLMLIMLVIMSFGYIWKRDHHI